MFLRPSFGVGVQTRCVDRFQFFWPGFALVYFSMSAQPALLPQTRSGRTFLIATILLGGIGAVQLGALSWHFIRGVPRYKPTAAIAADASAAPAFANRDGDAMPRVDELLGGPTPAPPGPSPVPMTVAVAPTFAVANARDLVAQARGLRQRGDTKSALARLREAQLGEPNNAEVLSEMAVLYEQTQNSELALEQWQRVYELGNAAGPAFYLAEMRLRTGMPVSTAAPRGAKESETATEAARDVRLGIVEVALRDEPDPTADKKLGLKITVKNRPGKFVDANKVSIQAFFYDSIDGKQNALTNAETAFQWLTNPAQWDETAPQTLEATYFRPKPVAPVLGSRGKKAAPEPAPAPATPRNFAGYIVRIYYDRVLQDVKAEPPSLLQQFPADPILGTE